MRRIVLACFTLFLILPRSRLRAATTDERIPVDATINGKPVRLAFDTGTAYGGLFPTSVERLGLSSTSPNSPGQPPVGVTGVTEPCAFRYGRMSGPVRFLILNAPSWLSPDVDGVVSWKAFGNYLFEFDLQKWFCGFPSSLPSGIEAWTKWSIVTNSQALVFECSNKTGTVRLGIDTGSDHGVWLSPALWRRFRAERPQAPTTLDSGFNPGEGLLIQELLRAQAVTVGGLTLHDVPVCSISPSMDELFEYSDAVLGLYALRQVKLVIDGPNHTVYTFSVGQASGEYDYNRLGALFAPKDPQNANDNDLVAHVIKDGPAYRAGIRDGDLLLKIDLLNVTVWRTDPYIMPLGRFWRQTAGTKHKLTLKRDGKLYETTVALEELPAVN